MERSRVRWKLAAKLRDLLELRSAVALRFQPSENATIGFLGQRALARHDPAVFARRMRHHGPLIVGIEVGDKVLCIDDAKEKHPPFGIGLMVINRRERVNAFLRGIKGPFAISKVIVDAAIGPRAIAFDGIDASLFCKVRNIGDHAPVAHITSEINVRHSFERREGGVGWASQRKSYSESKEATCFHA